MTKNRLLNNVFNLFNEKAKYAVLRNYENLPEESGRDIDLIIDQCDFNKIKSEFILLVEHFEYKILISDKRQFMHFIAIGKIENNSVNIISFDFIFHLHVKGVKLLETNRILECREFNGKIYHVRKDVEFLSKYIYNKLFNTQFPSKYSRLKNEAISNYAKEINEALNDIFGKNVTSIEDIERSKSYLLRKYFIKNRKKKNRISFYHDQINYYIIQLFRLIRPNGISIAFTGPDGVGKTTVINQIIEYINQVTSTTLFHHRPTLLGNLSNVAHQAGLKKEVDDDYTNPHRGRHNNPFSSFIRLFYYSLDYILGFQVKVRKPLNCGGVVIFDRYYSDIIVDAKRSSIYLNYKFLYGFGKLFIPSLDYNILLTASTDTILTRKKELDEEGIRTINDKIDYLADKKEYKKILNEQTPEVAVTEILSYIFENQHKKNLRRLK